MAATSITIFFQISREFRAFLGKIPTRWHNSKVFVISSLGKCSSECFHVRSKQTVFMKLILKCRDFRWMYGWKSVRGWKDIFCSDNLNRTGPQLFVAVFQLLIEFNYAISDTGGGVKGLFVKCHWVGLGFETVSSPKSIIAIRRNENVDLHRQ